MPLCKSCKSDISVFEVADFEGGGWCSSECWRGLPKPSNTVMDKPAVVEIKVPVADTSTSASSKSDTVKIVIVNPPVSVPSPAKSDKPAIKKIEEPKKKTRKKK